jgi:ArsR family transcriptional regulator
VIRVTEPAGIAVVSLLSFAVVKLIKLMARHNSIENKIFERQAMICKAFAHPTRLHLLDLLGKGECGVSTLQVKLRVPKANISQHLAILKSAGVVVTRRSGKQVYAALAIPEVKQACHLIHRVLRTQIRRQHRLAG